MKKKKLLLVDDDINFLEVFRRRLEKNGYEVITVFNGEDALKKLANEKPDAVLLDVLMPETDGLQILKRIREQNARLPVFIVTGFSNEERYDVANKFNAAGFIQKDSDLQKAVSDITDILSMTDKPEM